MNARVSLRIRSPLSSAACALTFAVISACRGVAFAQDEIASSPTLETQAAQRISDLEKAFWICDYTATTHGLERTPLAMCAAVTDELKLTKFDGDFDELVEWWQQKKMAEFEKLAVADVTVHAPSAASQR
jgi:hypothetical protein